VTKDVEWGPWIAHKGTVIPEELSGSEDVQTWRIDFSSCYLPEGRGANFEEENGFGSTPASDVRWENSPYHKMIVAYRVKKEPVVEVRKDAVTIGNGLAQFMAWAECTYTDGELTKIHWEASDAN
jgi:hypothetical protein